MLLLLLSCALSPNTPLSELEAKDRTAVCESVGIQAPVSATCESQLPLDVVPLDPSVCAEVWLPATCDATVDEWTLCQEAIAADPCVLQVGHAACDVLEACGIHLWSAAEGLNGAVSIGDISVPELETVCAVTNDYEAFTVPCEVEDLLFEPDEGLCLDFGVGGCGTLGQLLDCQYDLVNSGEAACTGLPPSCLFVDCS